MTHYADSSFLVSCYLHDVNTARAKVYLSSVGIALPFTRVHALEIGNAFELGVFRKLLTLSDAAAVWSDLDQDLGAGHLLKTAVRWPQTLRTAARLSKLHSAQVGTRSLDILHVATAQYLGASEFISFDVRQRALAAAVGLIVAP
jgi:predicted nucleic acid-binding protein